MTTRVAYLVSQYPAVSHVFIEREVLGLRARGVEVHTFSVRKPDPKTLHSEVMRAEAAATVVLQDDPKALALGNARLASSQLKSYAKALKQALRSGELGLKQRTWQVFYLAEAVKLYETMRERGLRHVHAHFANNGADIARLAVALGRAIDGPDAGWCWSFSMHGPTEFEEVTAFDLAAKTEQADGVACITDFTRSQLMRMVDPEVWPRLEIVHMSVEPERFPVPASREHDGPLRILDVGRLVPEKGGPILVDAVAQLKERGVDVQVRFVGAGALMERLQAEIDRRGLADRIELLGNRSQEEILEQYHWADVFVLPSFQEGLPVVIMEALSTGLPVVATRINGIGELVVDGVTGRLLTPGRSDLVAEAIEQLAGDPQLRQRLGAAGREAVLEGYTTATTAADMQRFLAGVQQRVAQQGTADRGQTRA
ncbi:glycosyltransferase family 4 protein [Luteococcus sp. OSA5]|uniref:glycosyltransferase family 4 protein n=1 Tax=Luteococcus sp. OSA5 TaxID=3401630 RepID=UPI003B4341F1